jgi:hypothetical protein
MANTKQEWLKVKAWGYQTVCPDEDNTRGYYEPVNRRNGVRFYDSPSFDADEVHYAQPCACWGWDLVKDNETRTTWVNIANNGDVWAPVDMYFSTDDAESDKSEQEEETSLPAEAQAFAYWLEEWLEIDCPDTDEAYCGSWDDVPEKKYVTLGSKHEWISVYKGESNCNNEVECEAFTNLADEDEVEIVFNGDNLFKAIHTYLNGKKRKKVLEQCEDAGWGN